MITLTQTAIDYLKSIKNRAEFARKLSLTEQSIRNITNEYTPPSKNFIAMFLRETGMGFDHAFKVGNLIE